MKKLILLFNNYKNKVKFLLHFKFIAKWVIIAVMYNKEIFYME